MVAARRCLRPTASSCPRRARRARPAPPPSGRPPRRRRIDDLDVAGPHVRHVDPLLVSRRRASSRPRRRCRRCGVDHRRHARQHGGHGGTARGWRAHEPSGGSGRERRAPARRRRGQRRAEGKATRARAATGAARNRREWDEGGFMGRRQKKNFFFFFFFFFFRTARPQRGARGGTLDGEETSSVHDLLHAEAAELGRRRVARIAVHPVYRARVGLGACASASLRTSDGSTRQRPARCRPGRRGCRCRPRRHATLSQTSVDIEAICVTR